MLIALPTSLDLGLSGGEVMIIASPDGTFKLFMAVGEEAVVTASPSVIIHFFYIK